jgi:hypothetical protein
MDGMIKEREGENTRKVSGGFAGTVALNSK